MIHVTARIDVVAFIFQKKYENLFILFLHFVLFFCTVYTNTQSERENA